MTQQNQITLDGAVKGHPFFGNQHVSASGESHTAVRSSQKAKHAEKHGDPKAQKKAHRVAHHAHMAAAEEAQTATTKKYHKTMAKFHGGRAGMTLDSVTFDDAEDFSRGSIVGKIMKGGQQMGRAVITGDGKAMVFVGESNDKRVVSTKTGITAAWGEDERMIEWLLAPVKLPEDAGGESSKFLSVDDLPRKQKVKWTNRNNKVVTVEINRESDWYGRGVRGGKEGSRYPEDFEVSAESLANYTFGRNEFLESQEGKDFIKSRDEKREKERAENEAAIAKNDAYKAKYGVFVESLDNELRSTRKKGDESALRKVRNAIFDAEDAVVKAIDGNDLAAFDPYKELFPKTYELLAQAVGAAVPGLESDELTVDGKESKVKTAKGTEVVTGFSVVEASRLITSHDPATGDVNPDFPQELQPRDRGRQTSRAWVLKTAANLDPEQLGKTRRADTGAPIVGKDRVVESGNGRTMAIIEAYRTGKADEYREWLESEAEYFGLDPQKVKAMKRPVLVRVRTSKVNRAEFAVEANQDDKLAMTATEKAKADANRLTDDMIALMTDNGDLNSAGNHRFLSAFLASLGDAEAAQYSTSDGKPTSSLIARVQAAIFAKAYKDDRLLELTADSAKPEIANIISALNFAAPEFIQAIALDPKATADATEKLTDSIEASLNEQAVAAIIAATNVIKQAKETGMQVDEFVKQQGLFGDIDPSVAAMAVFISKNNRSAKRMGSAFKAMATFVKGEIQRRQTTDMFGESVNVGFPEIIAAANRELEREYGEGVFAIETIDMFARKDDPAPTPEPTVTPDPAPPPADPKTEDRAFFMSVIDGSHPEILEPELADKLAQAYERHAGDAEITSLFMQAGNAYTQAMLAATEGV